jgi:hypothetical protein
MLAQAFYLYIELLLVHAPCLSSVVTFSDVSFPVILRLSTPIVGIAK